VSWIPDPFQLAQLPTVEEQEQEIDEPPTPEEIFHSSINHYPDTVGYGSGIHTGVCHFDETGNHTAMAQNCPHFDPEDEEGFRIRQGWTVQQRRNVDW
jgi:hypothetical protein